MRKEIVIKFNWINVVAGGCFVLALAIPVFLIDELIPYFFLGWSTCGMTFLGWIYIICRLGEFLFNSNNKN